MKKATRRLFLTLTNIVILCSALFVGVLAALEPAVSFSVNVTYEQAIKVKAYIATNAEDAGVFQQIDPTNDEGDNNFPNITNSALFLDTITDPGSYPQLESFQGLNEGNLHFGAEGIEFYIYVANFNADKTLICNVSINIENEDNFVMPEPSTTTVEQATESGGVITETYSLIKLIITPNEESTEAELVNDITINIAFSSGPAVSG